MLKGINLHLPKSKKFRSKPKPSMRTFAKAYKDIFSKDTLTDEDIAQADVILKKWKKLKRS